MEFDLFGERRSSHWVKNGGSAEGNFLLDSALENRRSDPGFDSAEASEPALTIDISQSGPKPLIKPFLELFRI